MKIHRYLISFWHVFGCILLGIASSSKRLGDPSVGNLMLFIVLMVVCHLSHDRSHARKRVPLPSHQRFAHHL